MQQHLYSLENKYGLPRGILGAVMEAESSGNPNAINRKTSTGKPSLGAFQFQPATAEAYGIDPMDPMQAADGAARMLRDLQKQYKGDVNQSLAAYNWGSGNLSKNGMNRLPQETRDYIKKVNRLMPKQYAAAGNIMNDASEVENPNDGGLTLEQQQAIAIAEAEAALGDSSEKPEELEISPDTSTERTVLDQSLQGLPLVGTFSDEATSALGALIASTYLNYRNNMPKALGGAGQGNEIDFSSEELFGKAREAGNERVAAQQEESPWISGGSQLASGILAGGAALKAAGATPTIFKGSADVANKTAKLADWASRGGSLRKAGKIAASGVPAAALYGLGDDSDEGRIQNAIESAPFGAIPAAIPLAGGAYNKLKPIAENLPKNLSKVKNNIFIPEAGINAEQKILQRLMDDNMTLEGLEQRLARSPEGTSILDVGRGNLERLAETSANLPGKGANDAVRFVSKRLSAEPKKVKQAVSNYVGEGDWTETFDRIAQEAEEKVKPLYQKAYAGNPSIQSDEIDRILATPAGRSALKKAAELMQNDRKLLGLPDSELAEQARLAGQDVNGGIASGLKLQTLDYVKRALDDMWTAARGTNEGRIINNLRRDLVSAIDEADTTGAYKEARSIWSGASAGKAALEEGKKIFSADTSDVKKYFNSLGESEKELYKLGVSQSLKDMVNSAPDRSNFAKKIFGREEYRDSLRAVLGNKEFNKLRAEMIRLEKQHLMNNRLLGNSRTALRAAEMQDFNVMDPEAAAQLLSGNPIGFMFRNLKNDLVARSHGLNRETAGEITSKLFETDKEKQKQIISALRKASQKPQKKSPLQTLKLTIRQSDKTSLPEVELPKVGE